MYSLDMDKAASKASLQIPLTSDHKTNSKLVTNLHLLKSYMDKVEDNSFVLYKETLLYNLLCPGEELGSP